MKISKISAKLVLLVLGSILAFSLPSTAYALSSNDNLDGKIKPIINSYIDAINDKDIDNYIALFTQDNQIEMRSYLSEYGKEDFFQEHHIELTNISKLSKQVGEYSSNLSIDELSKFSDTEIYYSEMKVQVEKGNGNENDDILDNGYTYRNFIVVNENGNWKISRVSSPDLLIISDAKESFGTDNEIAEIEDQKANNQLQFIKSSNLMLNQSIFGDVVPNIVLANPPTSNPTSITVYFTKSANSSYYGVPYKSLDWATYLKNVIPQEWVVSYYSSYPAYLRAGAMASKMYAWWYKNHPKWNYAPYYSNVKDSSSDQNFLYNAYSSMSSTYRGYEDAVLTLINNWAMCNNDGVMFEVHYHATQGTQYSGTLSASGALSLATSGYSMYGILDYYYSYSPYTGTNKYITIFGW